MSIEKYCGVCGKELIPTKIEKRFNIITGEPYDLKLNMHCPSNICGHTGVNHIYKKQAKGITAFFNIKHVYCIKCNESKLNSMSMF
jgi:hypothetical protein